MSNKTTRMTDEFKKLFIVNVSALEDSNSYEEFYRTNMMLRQVTNRTIRKKWFEQCYESDLINDLEYSLMIDLFELFYTGNAVQLNVDVSKHKESLSK